MPDGILRVLSARINTTVIPIGAVRDGHIVRLLTASRASASERSQRTFITMKVRSSYCSASRIQSFISSEIRALISSAGR